MQCYSVSPCTAWREHECRSRRSHKQRFAFGLLCMVRIGESGSSVDSPVGIAHRAAKLWEAKVALSGTTPVTA